MLGASRGREGAWQRERHDLDLGPVEALLAHAQR